MRILLVEDDLVLGQALSKALEKRSYGIDWMQDGESALHAVQVLDFRLVILDVNLPDIDGIAVLRALRLTGSTIPVLLLTARDLSSQRVEGLDAGADDYLVKPFDLEELLARIRALLRRQEGRVETVLKCQRLEVDTGAMVARLEGQTVSLPAKEFRVLKLLMERAGRFVTKRDIEYALYSAEAGVESNTTEVIIYNLRKKLGAELITSMRGVGYMIER
ncbi:MULTISPECIES: response regulator transcription factor [Ochrobactrum]|uniref:Flagellar transcriptional regulator FtcR n=1 Tax=Ochrobactrum quorumnocens TaxID=271865 RepID=A0A5N1JNF4_9HYPH|nr:MULTISPECIES: response regulator transcription factor [Brucella/Ochrobactrum group]KAA9356139.1 response regulator transcription factor [[Ochrobactrum] quorumnocens]MBD7993235.1 response regulator transcription factor [Ochrobactrum gallinarum]MDH7793646.1 DNA-binding response OmpR family regulator [Ochrobactrum sp. AN78]